MYTLAKLGTHDLNSDGKFDKNDEYGLGHAFSSAFCLFHGSGERFASLDESGKPVITINDSRSAEVVKKIADIYNDNSVVGVVEKNFGDWTTLNANMVAGKVMFRPANIYNLRQYLQMTDVCGVLPIPKYEATQDRYYHLVLTNACSGYCVPSTNSDLAMTGIIMEELAYYGRKDLTPAYYDSYIKSRLTPDLDTRDMFDIIFSSKIYDVGYTFGWGSLVNVIGSAVSTNGGFTSKLDAAMSGAQTAMDKTYNDLIDVWGE
ncbi:hypothetical protein SDC9_98256 [bioreactor metagenome]|uniref:Extracellular solute-binding protein n=1 Tax=bioreactor metagenome TaxID=1076179 RepID=A0A645AEQ6_9ZZZZ